MGLSEESVGLIERKEEHKLKRSVKCKGKERNMCVRFMKE